MILTEAQALAQSAVYALSPYCERIEIAGSIRRRKAEVKDAEIVCIPKCANWINDLFGTENRIDPEFIKAVQQWPALKGQPTGKYTQRLLPWGLNLDLFMTTPEQWGSILLIRTGPAEFSKRVMGSLLPRQGYKCNEGYIWRDGTRIPTLEEADVFQLADIRWIEPWNRN